MNVRNNEVCKMTLEHHLSQKAVTTTFRFKLILYKEWERYCYEIDKNNSGDLLLLSSASSSGNRSTTGSSCFGLSCLVSVEDSSP
jgi:hypothetical protein